MILGSLGLMACGCLLVVASTGAGDFLPILAALFVLAGGFTALQVAANPLAGDVIEGTGGLRKVRVAAKGRGKRGGARVIYYHVSSAAQIRLLLIYAKGRKDDLSADEKRALRGLNERW